MNMKWNYADFHEKKNETERRIALKIILYGKYEQPVAC